MFGWNTFRRICNNIIMDGVLIKVRRVDVIPIRIGVVGGKPVDGVRAFSLLSLLVIPIPILGPASSPSPHFVLFSYCGKQCPSAWGWFPLKKDKTDEKKKGNKKEEIWNPFPGRSQRGFGSTIRLKD
jgi:hypothetical protein